MNFFDQLQNYEPEPPRREKTPEEQMEETIREWTSHPELQKVAKDMLWQIKKNCWQATERGEKRLFGFLRGFCSESSDSDGYSLPTSYYGVFYPWKDGVRRTTEYQTFDPRQGSTLIFSYDSLEAQQATMIILADLMRQEGFPDGTLSSACHTIEWRMAEGVPESSRQGWGKYTVEYTKSYVTEVDIRW